MKSALKLTSLTLLMAVFGFVTCLLVMPGCAARASELPVTEIHPRYFLDSEARLCFATTSYDSYPDTQTLANVPCSSEVLALIGKRRGRND